MGIIHQFFAEVFATPLYKLAESPNRGRNADGTRWRSRSEQYLAIKLTMSRASTCGHLNVTDARREVYQRKGAKRPSLRYVGHFGFFFVEDEAMAKHFLKQVRAQPGVTKAELVLRH